MTVNGQVQQFWPVKSMDARYSDPSEMKECHQTEEVIAESEENLEWIVGEGNNEHVLQLQDELHQWGCTLSHQLLPSKFTFRKRSPWEPCKNCSLNIYGVVGLCGTRGGLW